MEENYKEIKEMVTLLSLKIEEDLEELQALLEKRREVISSAEELLKLK